MSLDAIAGLEAVPVASLLKPLYAWVTAEADPADVAAAIQASDNTATDRIVEAAGGLGALLDRLRSATGVRLDVATSWGQVRARATEAQAMYDHLLAAAATGTGPAATVVDHMRAVVGPQRFGAPAEVPVKAGWDVELATGAVLVHVVVADPTGRARVGRTRNHVEAHRMPDPFAGAPALDLATELQGDLAARVLRRHTSPA